MPKNMPEITRIIREELNYHGVSVIIPRRECIQTFKRHAKEKKAENRSANNKKDKEKDKDKDKKDPPNNPSGGISNLLKEKEDMKRKHIK